MYGSDNEGVLVPGWIDDATVGAAAGMESWATILVNMKYLPSPEQQDFNSPTVGESVFRCPSGADKKSEIGPGVNDKPCPKPTTATAGYRIAEHRHTPA